MEPAEIKLFVATPSLKNWPLPLAGGGLLVLTGAIGFALQALSANAAIVIASAGLALMSVPAVRAANTEYVVTNARIVRRSGLFVKSERAVAIAAVTELRLKRSPLQRAMGLGDLEAAGAQGGLTLEGLEDPETVRDRILSLAA